MLKQVAEGVLVHQSEMIQNNTVVVQGGNGVLLIDAGITGEEMVCLANDLRELGQPVVAGFSTHPDWDHVLWHAELGDVPRYGTARCAAHMREVRSKADWKAHVAEGLPPEMAGDSPLDLFGLITGLPAGTTRIPWDGPAVRIIEHPAHSVGHAALVIEERGVLVAGDMLSDLLVPMLDNWKGTNDPIEDYLVGLRAIEDVADEVDAVIPGHGSVGRGAEVRARIEQDRAYVLALRDTQVFSDPRVSSAQPGYEWVGDIHEGQLQSLSRAVADTKPQTAQGKVLWHFTMSLDGFVAGPNHAMGWMTGVSRPGLNEEYVETTGAVLGGRDGFDAFPVASGTYGGWQGPVFILTHHPEDAPPTEDTTFLNCDVAEAVRIALVAAGGKNVEVLSASVGRQLLERGLIDEIDLHIAPVLLGDGIRLFDNPGGAPVPLELLNDHGRVTTLNVRYRPAGRRQR